MKNNLTELVFILDRSGSMAGLEDDTIGGFNAMIEKQKKQDGMCYVSTVLFDHESLVLHDRLPLDKLKPMTHDDYTVRGCTALLDAVGSSIHHIKNIHKYLRSEDVPAHTVFVITTDGMENASKRYTAREIKKTISQQKRQGWEFLFLGANIDAVKSAGEIGIGRERAVNYRADRKGTAIVYDTVGDALCKARACMSLENDWGRKISEDYESRK